MAWWLGVPFSVLMLARWLADASAPKFWRLADALSEGKACTLDALASLPIGKGLVVRSISEQLAPQKKIAFICFGPLLYNALSVAQEMNATVVDMRFVKPLDVELVKALASSHDLIVTIEENAIMGGAGAAVVVVGAAVAVFVDVGGFHRAPHGIDDAGMPAG